MSMAFHEFDSGSGDEDQVEKMRAFLSPNQVDYQIRQAIQFLWISLPKEKRNIDEVEMSCLSSNRGFPVLDPSSTLARYFSGVALGFSRENEGSWVCGAKNMVPQNVAIH